MYEDQQVTHNGATYYVGEEIMYDADHKEIGWTASRGGQVVVVALDEHGERVAQMEISTKRTVFETEADVVKAVDFLLTGTFK